MEIEKKLKTLDFQTIDTNFKSTEFIDSLDANETFCIKNAFSLDIGFDWSKLDVDKNKDIDLSLLNTGNQLAIDLILEANPNIPVKNGSGFNTLIAGFHNTIYTLSDLKQTERKKMYLENEIKELSNKFDEFYNIPKNIPSEFKNINNIKKEMLIYTIYKELCEVTNNLNMRFFPDTENRISLNEAICIGIQDSELHKNFGDIYKYYITSVIVRKQQYFIEKQK